MLNHRLTDSRKAGDEPVLPAARNEIRADAGGWPRPVKKLAVLIVVLIACFARPLYLLAESSLHSQFFSYILLIPVITVYLIWINKSELPAPSGVAWKGAAVAAVGGLALLLGWQWGVHSGWKLQTGDYISVMTAAFLFFVVAGCLFCLGPAFSRAIAFPLAFLVFMIPMPPAMLDAVMLFFQRTSAAAAAGFLRTAFMPVFRDGLDLYLPGYTISVDPECSGIHSTMVLLITGVLAGHMFLRSKWKRALLILVVIPLAILRNGFRIFVISEMCVRISHAMIDSPVHRRGGPLFFALSLIPFFLVLYWLRKSELRAPKNVDALVKA
jgi:exosortase C (VPDSG-CTERM-specific)